MTIWTATAYPMPSSRAARFRTALTVSMAILTDHPRNIVLGIPGRATALEAIGDQLLPWNIVTQNYAGRVPPDCLKRKFVVSLSMLMWN